MLVKNVSYKGISLASSQFSHPVNPSYWVLQDFNMSVSYDTKIENVSMYHGERWYTTLAWWRMFKISGVIADINASNRQDGINYLMNIIRPEWILSNSPEYKIEWEDFSGRKFWSMARVFSEISFSHQIKNTIIEYSFDLWSESPQYFGDTLRSYSLTPSQQSFWLFSGGVEGVHLWYIPEIGNLSWWFSLTNYGNFEAWVEITDSSGWDGVFYINNTNWLRYWVNWLSLARVIDTRVRPTIVTDYWVDNSKNRMKWSTWFLLSPWVNIVSANITNYDYNNPPITNSITMKWYDTYI